jgi:HlyD family secretion protein
MKDKQDPVVYKTEQASTKTIVKKTVATGSIVPKEEVLIKPNISGIIKEVYVQAGDIINAGDLIAQIEVVPNVSSLTNAKNTIAGARTAVETAKLAFSNQKSIYERQKALFDKGVISANDFDGIQNTYNAAEQRVKQEQVNLTSALQNYDIIKTGTTSGLGNAATTQVRSTITGMILDVPVKAGNQVIEANNFNDGTTIATLADVDKMIFEGKVDEGEVGKLKIGMPLKISLGAIEGEEFDAKLKFIAPKGVEETGAVQFKIEGDVEVNDDVLIRAGYSANASLVLDRRDSVMVVPEALLQFDKKTDKPYVEVATGEQEFERRDIEIGISDGVNVEILSGLSEEDKVKQWNKTEPVKKGEEEGEEGEEIEE